MAQTTARGYARRVLGAKHFVRDTLRLGRGRQVVVYAEVLEQQRRVRRICAARAEEEGLDLLPDVRRHGAAHALQRERCQVGAKNASRSMHSCGNTARKG